MAPTLPHGFTSVVPTEVMFNKIHKQQDFPPAEAYDRLSSLLLSSNQRLWIPL